MSYYENKIMALKMIDDLLADGTSVDFIIYKVTTKYGFSKKIVLDRIKQIEAVKNE